MRDVRRTLLMLSQSRSKHLLVVIPVVVCLILLITIGQTSSAAESVETSTIDFHHVPTVDSNTMDDKVQVDLTRNSAESNTEEDVDAKAFATGNDVGGASVEKAEFVEEVPTTLNEEKSATLKDEEMEKEVLVETEKTEEGEEKTETTDASLAGTKVHVSSERAGSEHIGKMTLETILMANPNLAAAIKQAEKDMTEAAEKTASGAEKIDEKEKKEEEEEEEEEKKNEEEKKEEEKKEEEKVKEEEEKKNEEEKKEEKKEEKEKKTLTSMEQRRKDETEVMAGGAMNGIPVEKDNKKEEREDEKKKEEEKSLTLTSLEQRRKDEAEVMKGGAANGMPTETVEKAEKETSSTLSPEAQRRKDEAEVMAGGAMNGMDAAAIAFISGHKQPTADTTLSPEAQRRKDEAEVMAGGAMNGMPVATPNHADTQILNDEAAVMAGGSLNGMRIRETFVEPTPMRESGKRVSMPKAYLEDHDDELAAMAAEMSEIQRTHANIGIPVHFEDTQQ